MALLIGNRYATAYPLHFGSSFLGQEHLHRSCLGLAETYIAPLPQLDLATVVVPSGLGSMTITESFSLLIELHPFLLQDTYRPKLLHHAQKCSLDTRHPS